MPLYTYRCTGCGFEFEELVSYEKRDGRQVCKKCREEAVRKVGTSFRVKSRLDPKRDTITTNNEIDRVVGESAEKRWEGYNERWKENYESRRRARWKGKEPTPIALPKESDGYSRPLMHLGNKKDRSLRKEFSEALQEHRKRRREKGIKQFDGPGAIET